MTARIYELIGVVGALCLLATIGTRMFLAARRDIRQAIVEDRAMSVPTMKVVGGNQSGLPAPPPERPLDPGQNDAEGGSERSI